MRDMAMFIGAVILIGAWFSGSLFPLLAVVVIVSLMASGVSKSNDH